MNDPRITRGFPRAIEMLSERHPRIIIDAARHEPEVSLYAVAYRPLRRDGKNEIDIWRSPLALGKPLPELPLADDDV